MKKCGGCGRKYEVELMIPGSIWSRIKPDPKRAKGGYLCGACILNRMEGLQEYRACGLQILVTKDGLCEDAEIMTFNDMLADAEKTEAEMDRAFTYDAENDCMTISVAYPYHIELNRIASKAHLLEWVLHLNEKTWASTMLVKEFAIRVCKIKEWQFCP